jgi:hypothetical protein
LPNNWDQLEAFMDRLEADRALELDSDVWEHLESAFYWEANRTWRYWYNNPYETLSRTRIYVEKAGPAMRPHP